VKAFMPGRSGRLVAGDGFDSGLGLTLLLLPPMFSAVDGLRSAAPLELCTGASCELVDLLDLVDFADFVETLLLFRPSFLMEPNSDRFWVGSGSTIHGEVEGMVGGSDMNKSNE